MFFKRFEGGVREEEQTGKWTEREREGDRGREKGRDNRCSASKAQLITPELVTKPNWKQVRMPQFENDRLTDTLSSRQFFIISRKLLRICGFIIRVYKNILNIFKSIFFFSILVSNS